MPDSANDFVLSIALVNVMCLLLLLLMLVMLVFLRVRLKLCRGMLPGLPILALKF